MDPRPPTPEDSEFTKSAKALYEVMTDLFERSEEFNPLYYSTSFDFAPRQGGPFYLPGGIRSFIESEFDVAFTLNPHARWQTTISYDPKDEGLSVARLSAPIKRNGHESTLDLVRYDPLGWYLPITGDGPDTQTILQPESESLEAMVYDKSTVLALTPEHIRLMLDEAGIHFNPSTHPQHWLAPALDNSTNWRRQEHFFAPISADGSQANVERTSFCKVGYSENGSTSDCGGYIRYCDEQVMEDGERRQLRVAFPTHEYTVDEPQISIRVLGPSSTPSEVANNGPGSYVIKSEERVAPTSRLLDQIHEGFLDVYGDVA